MGSDRKNITTHYGSSFSDEAASLYMIIALYDGKHMTVAKYNMRSGEFENYASEVVRDKQHLDSLLNTYKAGGERRFLSVADRAFTLIPEGIFSPEHSDDYLSLLFPEELVLNKKKIAHHNVRSDRAQCVYALDNTVFSTASKHGFTVNHAAPSNLSFIGDDIRAGDNPAGVLFIYTDFFYLFLFHGGLLLSNAFPIASEADLAYYTLFAMEQRGLTGSRTSLYYSSNNADEHVESLGILDRYVRDVRKLSRGELIRTSSRLESMPEGTGINLFSQLLCV